ncbi:MAG: T9SS type A sorting domain-containing protein [bacterium]|nr:T9SS type A sorting domain-containing protein [bacterium]
MFNRFPYLLVILIAIFALTAPSPAVAEVTAVPITATDQLLSGADADGQIGDYLIANGLMAVIISAPAHSGYYAATGGNIIDVARVGESGDALAEFYTYFNDDWPRQAEYTSISIIADGAGGGPAIIRVEGRDSQSSQLLVSTDYTLAEGASSIMLTTTLHNTGSTAFTDFILGDALSWGSCDNFAPGFGFTLTGDTVCAWLAGVAENVSYGYCAQEPSLWGDHGSGWTDINVTTLDIPAQGEVAYTRYLTLGDGDVASAADIIHELQGLAVGLSNCTVTAIDTDLPIPDAGIDVYDNGGSIYLRMECDNSGVAAATLPQGSWRLVANAVGYGDEETWVTITEGQTSPHDFVLAEAEGGFAFGDTLTVIQRPLLNVPAIITSGDTLLVECEADPTTTGWAARLLFGSRLQPLELLDATLNTATTWWELRLLLPAGIPFYELYDLQVSADGGILDTTRNAVRIIPAIREDFYFIQITDTHLPTNLYYTQAGSETDSSSNVDLRAVFDDINIINPEFILLTGDLINEGELEDFLQRRYYSRAQHLLAELQVPVYLVGGNHDLGGWDSTPPADGTARRDWWRFFGWRRLNAPPAGAPWRTQNYSFDYGPVHFIGLEAYDNYDMWRSEFYGAASFTSPQIIWLTNDLTSSADAQSHVLFHHNDFSNQINLTYLGIDMELWGHVHSDGGSLVSQPWSLSTNNTCHGERSYRLIKVSDGVLSPRATLSAGSSGNNLRVVYNVSTEGGVTTSEAQVANLLQESFENALLRFTMPNGPGTYEVSQGTLVQIDDSGEEAICYVEIEIPAASVLTVEMTYGTTAVGDQPELFATGLLANHPNPFNPKTRLRYNLARDRRIRLTVHDTNGRNVATLHDGPQSAGEHHLEWTAADDNGRALPSGVYFLRLDTGEQTFARKLTLLR